MIVLIDQDGTLADFCKKLRQEIKKYPKIPTIPFEQWTSYRVEDVYPASTRKTIEKIYHTPGFFKNIPPITGAIQATKDLIKEGHEIIICTAPLSNYENCVLEKYQWVEKHFGRELTKKIILTKDKTIIKADILIDDKPIIEGLSKPKWKHVIFDAPYNRHIKNKPRIVADWSNWREIILK